MSRRNSHENFIVFAMILASTAQLSYGQIQRGGRGGGGRVATENRSNEANRGGERNANRGGERNVSQNATANRNVNQNANVNRNVNVNQNVNVNRNVNVNTNGGYYGGCCYHEDNNWGAFAAGAVVAGVTTAAVASASSSHAAPAPAPTTNVNTIPVGSVVPSIPGGCATIAQGTEVIYNCNNVYYKPFYQGQQLVYQVITQP